MAVPKIVRDAIKDELKDPEWCEATNDLAGHYFGVADDPVKNFCELLRDYVNEGPAPKGYIPFIDNNRNYVYDGEIYLVPIKKARPHRVAEGRLVEDSTGEYAIANLPENATHIDTYSGQWYEIRKLTPEEVEAQETLRIEAVDDAIKVLKKDIKSHIKETRQRRADEAKRIKATMNTSTKLHTVSFSVTDEQLESIQGLLSTT